MQPVDQWRAQSIKRNLERFETDAGTSRAQIASIKLRPVAQATGLSDRYVYANEYRELAAGLGLQSLNGQYEGGNTHRFKNGAVLVEHETGPEILIAIRQVADAIGPFVTLADAAVLVGGVATTLASIIRRYCKRASNERYHKDVGFIRVERRMVTPSGDVMEEVITVLDLDAKITEAQLAPILSQALEQPRSGA